MVSSAILEQIVQALAAVAWNRPELTPLRDPIEAALKGDPFKQLTQQAFTTFAERSRGDLPDFFNAAFIEHEVTQRALARYIVDEDATAIPQLARRYADFIGETEEAVEALEAQLENYLMQVRETFAADSTYGPLLLTRDVQVVVAGINNLQADMGHVKTLLEQLLQEPEIKALVERRQGTHVFLSYTRADLAIAARVRDALEAVGHRVWQDVTAIKGGREWIRSIEDGIERAYVVVSLVSAASQVSEWVTIEFLHAKRRHKPIVPLKVDVGDIPMMMLALNVVHGHPDLEAGLAGLLAALPQPSGEAEQATVEPSDPRQQEIAYLDSVLLEHSVWQTVYTPMAGVARLRQQPEKREIKRAAAHIQPLFAPLGKHISETFAEAPALKEEVFEDITEAVNRVKQLVVLGDPGAGKTTTLWRLAADYAEAAKRDPNALLPVLLHLGSLPPAVSVRQQLQTQLGHLSLDELLKNNRLVLLLDALNELPEERREDKVAEVRELVKMAQDYTRALRSELDQINKLPKYDKERAAELQALLDSATIVVVTCRDLDYKGVLDLNIDERVTITPLDAARIRQFCLNHLPEDGEVLFWQISRGEQNAAWRKARSDRSLIKLAQNPYILFMMTEVYAETGVLPPNRGKLFDLFVTYLLREREKLSEDDATALRQQLAEIAYMMQDEARGTAIGRDLALAYLTEKQIYYALSANLLEGSGNMRFTHQLLQEYFAAQKLNQELLNGTVATRFWPSERWGQPQGWEETAVMLAGLYNNDTTKVVEWLCDVNPELMARCILESGAHTPDATLLRLRKRWLPRLTDMQSDPQPEVRAAIGRALVHLRLSNGDLLDNRKGIGLNTDGLPDIVWCEVPDGVFQMGGDLQAFNVWNGQQIRLDYTFYMAQYPITFAQYASFITDDGYTTKTYWTETGWAWKGARTCPRYWNDPYRHMANHPVVGVTWYEAYAFCQWLNRVGAHLKPDPMLVIRLPTEAEWEKAARYPDGRVYPWGNEYISGYANINETTQYVGDEREKRWGEAYFLGRTSVVGLYPQGANPVNGLCDLSGNVWEWCSSKWEEVYKHPENNDPTGNAWRAVRGGSWVSSAQLARATARLRDAPDLMFGNQGFRICAAPNL